MFRVSSITWTIKIRNHSFLLLDTIQTCIKTHGNEKNKNFLIDMICSQQNEAIIAISIDIILDRMFITSYVILFVILMKKMDLVKLIIIIRENVHAWDLELG